MNKKVQEYIDKHYADLSGGTYFLDTFDETDGQPCLRTWALHKLKGKEPQVKEIVREYLDGHVQCHGDLYFVGAAGWKVNWGNRKYHSYYISSELDDHWYDINKRPGMSTIRLFKNLELISVMTKYIPYFTISETTDIMEYAKRFREFPDVERLSKAGFEYLVMDKRVLKLSKQSKKKLVSWLMSQENNDYVKQHRPSYNDITRAIKKGWTMEKYYYEYTIDEWVDTFKDYEIKRTRSEVKEIYDYLKGRRNHTMQLIGLLDYIDYLKIAKEMGFDMTLKSVIYPRDARRAHDTLARNKKVAESKEINEKLEKIASILKPYEVKRKDLKIVIPTCQKDFIKWGQTLKICVGTYGYDKKMVQGSSVILMVYQGNKPLECCELVKKANSINLEICQLSGKHNQDSERHKECEHLVNTFIRNYKNQQLIGACI